jgi:hypothetical protein
VRLWHLLIGCCFAVPVGSALAPARIAEAGTGGYVLATATGLVVGASFSWIMWWMHKSLVPNLLHRLEQGDPLSEWYGRAFYASKALWIIFAGVLGFWLSSTLIRWIL